MNRKLWILAVFAILVLVASYIILSTKWRKEAEIKKDTNISSSNNINNTIPDGFRIIESEKEIIISDENRNEFVWIPVDGKDVTLSRKTFQANQVNKVDKKETIEKVYYGEESPFSCLYKFKKENENYSLDFFEESVNRYRWILYS